MNPTNLRLAASARPPIALALAAAFYGFVGAATFVGHDVALVQIACAMPLAMMLAACIERRASTAGLLSLAALLLGVVVFHGTSLAPVMLRPLLAMGVATSAALVAAAVCLPGETAGWPAFAVAIIACVLLPATYVAARVRHDVAQLGELLDQSRFGEARALSQHLLTLSASATWQGKPVSQVAADLEKMVANLERQVEAPLPPHANAGQRLHRARLLAMLGRTDTALEVLATIDAPPPEADNLRGAIHEAKAEWSTALAAYHAAKASSEACPESKERQAARVQATTGIAYCERKQGRYAAAESAYLALLSLAPTADSHFLLAQFYEDAQRTGLARDHARRAMALDPARYQQPGETLLRKLAVGHFGCFAVHSQEWSAK
jgi:hypothetical protein